MASIAPECSSSSGTNVATAKEKDEPMSSPLTHLFVELTSLEELSFPTSSSARIKYTCLDASAHYLAVGSTSGTVYLFSRFASKHRNRISSVPIQVISIKDGPVIKLSISPDEKYLATASRRGSLTITALVGIGQNPVTLFSTDCHVGTDENGQSTHITELCWCDDSSKIYAGDTKGRISQTRIQNRNFFRSPSDIIFETDSEIVQIDLRDDTLLVSNLTRCCVCDLKTRSCIQVGKRLRNGHFGAIFYSDQRKRKLLYGEENNSAAPSGGVSGSTELTVIFASRPNGRLWEANGRGVVYSTHQYRNLRTVCRFPVVSFKDDALLNKTVTDDEIRNIIFERLTLIRCQDNLFVMTKTDTSFCLIDPTDSIMVLMSTMDCIDSVSEYSVNDADVFLLSSRTGSLRKLTLFTLEKAVEKLHWRQCYTQAAQVIYANHVMNRNCNLRTTWKCELLEDILNKIADPHFRLQITPNVMETLHKLLNEVKKNGGMKGKPKATVCRLNSGIHRVVQIMENSGYEDDFTFRAPSPLRIRSKSTPHMEIAHGWKRRSLPLNQGAIAESGGDETAEVPEDPEEHRRKLINEARMLLLDAEKTPANQLMRNGSVESLRTLLDCSNTLIVFDQQVTLNDVTKDLEAAKKFLRLLGSNRNNGKELKQRKLTTEQVDFKSLFGRRDPLEILEKCVESMPLSINVNVARLRTIRRKRGARIIKGIKPFGRRTTPSENECNESDKDEQISQHPLKRDPTSNESLNLNCNGTQESEESSKRNSDEQPMEDEIRLLNKSYVVEKNFVAVRPIEVTWTMNGGEEENDLVSMKSSAATLTLNDGGDERLMQSSEVTVAHTTMTLSEAKKMTENNSACCQICGLHRLWRHVLTFGPKMSQLRVTVDHFTDGGVPISMEQWTKLFEYRAAAVASVVEDGGSTPEGLCDDCAEFFQFDEHLQQKASSLRETVERFEKRCREKKYTENPVQITANEWDKDFVYNIFFKNILITEKDIRRDQKKLDVDSSAEVPAKEPNLDQNFKKFSWLPAVTISQLLLCMRYCEGLGAVFELLKNNKTLTTSLTTEDWQWIAVIKAYECTRHLDLMPKEVVTDLLSELKISTIEDVGATSTTSFSDSGSSGVSSSRSSSGSLTVSVDGNCPCCTLPLKMRVTQSEGYITIFRCGHLYHQICLREANLSRCIRCEIERRRHRQLQQHHLQQQHVGSSSGTFSGSQRQSAATTRSPRHAPIKAVHTTVTSAVGVKTPRRT